MRYLLPFLLALIGAAAGIGAGLFLQPSAEAVAASEGGTAPMASHSDDPDHDAEGTGQSGAAPAHGGQDGSEFTKLNNQFVVPVLGSGRVKSMVVLSLSLETPVGGRELIFSREPRIRDELLQVLFDHANLGGFDGEFTNGRNMDLLRKELLRAARNSLGGEIFDVLITDIARQDLG